jgi:beta-lactamase regulating signal transducer with metallopeptidase domain
MISPLVESAFRSVLLAIAVGVGLRAFRVRNVPAQKAAWGLVLAAAFMMPVLAPMAGKWQLRPVATVNLPARPLSLVASLLPQPKTIAPRVEQPRVTAVTSLQEPESAPAVEHSALREPIDAPASGSPAAVIADIYQGTPSGQVPQQAITSQHTLSISDLVWLGYFSVAVTLVFRLTFGLVSAVLLWMGAEPIVLRNGPRSAEGLSLRASREVFSPVTVGSAVILPADYADWDAEKLRIVLAHERSHIRQGDFYLQLLASLYAAVFWFSPLGWWLRGKLSDLAETISDRAGLEQAINCSSYAQILLEFAAAPRPTLTGVAMARSRNLSRRIESLLNDRSFRQAFAGGRGRMLAAVLLVPLALFVSTAVVRVKAAAQDAQKPAPATQQAPNATTAPEAQPAPAAQPEAPITGQSKPEPDVDSTSTPAPEAAPAAPAAPAVAPVAPSTAVPLPPTGERIIVVPQIPQTNVIVPPIPPITVRVPDTAHIYALVQKATAEAYSYHYSTNGDSYGVVRGNDEHVWFSGDLHSVDIDKIRKQAHGDFLWFNRDGKYYFVDDPATISQIEAMYKPIEELGKRQHDLGEQQRQLGEQQRALGHQQEQASVPTPDMSKEMAELNAAMAKLQAKMGKTVTQQELSDIQNKLGDLQGRLGEIEGEIGARQGELGAQEGRLGAEEGRLGAQEGRLGAEQGRLAREADRKIRSIIDESLQNGRAHPVE